jgi:hypothetical protein
VAIIVRNGLVVLALQKLWQLDFERAFMRYAIAATAGDNLSRFGPPLMLKHWKACDG